MPPGVPDNGSIHDGFHQLARLGEPSSEELLLSWPLSLPSSSLQASLRAIDRVVTAQSHEDKQAQINELVAAFKGEGGDELLKACRAILRQRKARGQKLARGTTKPSSAPDYLIKSCLALFTGVDVSVFTNMTAEDNKNYFFLAFAGKPHYHYPQTQMPLPEFYDWIQKHYESLGRPLHRYPLPTASAEFIDWELEVGIYAYSKEGDDDGEGIPPETVLTQLIDRAHKVKIKLPKEFHCKVQDLGTTWSLKDNYGQHEAYLYNHATRMQRPCGSFFTCAEPECLQQHLPRGPGQG